MSLKRLSLKRLLIFNVMKDKHDYTKVGKEHVMTMIRARFNDASTYLRKVCADDLIKYSQKKKDEQS